MYRARKGGEWRQRKESGRLPRVGLEAWRSWNLRSREWGVGGKEGTQNQSSSHPWVPEPGDLGLPRRASKHTSEDKARVRDGLVLRPPDVREAEESGGVEAVHHRDHLLLPVTLPAGRGRSPAQQWTEADTWGPSSPAPKGSPSPSSPHI